MIFLTLTIAAVLSSFCTSLVSSTSCMDSPMFHFGNNTEQSWCCEYHTKRFRQHQWYQGRRYLTNYLANMKAWNCSEFHQECQQPIFNLTDFTSLVYDYYCDYDLYQSTCNATLEKVLPAGTDLHANWSQAVSQLNTSLLSYDNLFEPCVQVATFESQQLNEVDNFYEIQHITVPTCDFIWQGFDASILGTHGISRWSLVPTKCRVSVISIMVLCYLLGAVIVILNLAVLLVFKYTSKLINRQALCKISIAIGDLLAGLIVLPTLASSLGKSLFTAPPPFREISVVGDVFVNGSWQMVNTTIIEPSSPFKASFSKSYLAFVGLFTTFSLMVSIYSLFWASIDRYLTIRFPAKYHGSRAWKINLGVLIFVWLISVIFSILPFIAPSVYYALLGGFLILAMGTSRLTEWFYVVALVFPLLCTWLFTGLTYSALKKQSKRLASFANPTTTTGTDTLNQPKEDKLAKTLAIMVGFFTASLLPPITCFLVLSAPGLRSNEPKKLNQSAFIAYTTLEYISILLFLCNSLWNFFIYNARSKTFRSAYKQLQATVMVSVCPSFLKCSSCCQPQAPTDDEEENANDTIEERVDDTEVTTAPATPNQHMIHLNSF